MAGRWVVDEDYPDGHLVAMTPEEQAQHERDQAAGAAAADAQAQADAAAAARAEDLRRARIELATGLIFASFSASERKVLDLLLARVALER